MLTNLTVENYALIERLEIAFDPGLNIITGETGAGKSILMGALGLLLGARSDADAIKDASRNCVIEGEFDLPDSGLQELFDRNDVDYAPHTVIRRVISPNGKSRAYVNDLPVQLSFLKELGAYIIDIHSQHQNLILTSGQFRMKAVDTVAGCTDTYAEYRRTFTEWGRLRSEVERMRAESAKSHEDEEWLRHQVNELEAASLRDGEVEELEAEQRTLENADSILQAIGLLTDRLESDETGVLASLRSAESALRHIESDFPAATGFIERLRSTGIELRDIAESASAEAQRIESDPERLETVNNRLTALYTLCRKHGAENIAELMAVRDTYAERLNRITHIDEETERKSQEAERYGRRAEELAAELHRHRKKAAPALSKEVREVLLAVGMPDARFEIRLTPTPLTANGCDDIEFAFSANAGMEPRPIEKIASGGELSRVMLALKSVLARRLELPTVIFDEIDSGISGRTADAVGRIIASLSESMQVVDITHLPQVASKGSTHLLVYKSGNTSHIRQLSPQERVEEIAKMLSGDRITDAALEQARILLENGTGN